MNTLVFNIATVPDVAAGRRLYGNRADMANLSDEDVVRVMHHHNQQELGEPSEHLRPHLQKVIAIAAVLRSGERLRIDSLGTPQSTETEIIQQFFKSIQHYTPTLVSWDGGRRDLPVLQYRALLHGIYAQRYWDIHKEFRFNNYTHRYHDRHTDLMDVLAGYQPAAFVSLNELATLLGFPSQPQINPNQVWELYLQGHLQEIRAYGELKALNTYLVWLRFELMRGYLNQTDYNQECQRVREVITAEDKPHFDPFLEAWSPKLG